MRGAVTQALAGPVIEQVHRIIDLLLAHLEEAGLLGKVLAQQPIVVLIERKRPTNTVLTQMLNG